MAVTGSPNMTSHAAVCVPGSVLASDWQSDLTPAPVSVLPAVSSDTPEAPADLAAPTVPTTLDQLIVPEASITSDASYISAPALSTARVSETSSGPSTAASTTAATCTKSTYPALAPARPKSFEIFMGWTGCHCPCRGCSVLALKLPWSQRDATVAKASPGAPQESKVTTRLAVNLRVKASIASPVEIVSNMGTTREATVGVDMTPK